jgi:phosphoenolpyruvate carboxylase
MMSLTKSFFQLTAYMQNDSEYGAFWTQIHDEYERSKKYLLKLTGQSELMDNEPAGKASIVMREKIVLPLLTIQQYALGMLHKKGGDEVLEKMVTRSLFGNINASRKQTLTLYHHHSQVDRPLLFQSSQATQSEFDLIDFSCRAAKDS